MSEHTSTRVPDPPSPADSGEVLRNGITMTEIKERVRTDGRRTINRLLGRSLATRFGEDVEQTVLIQVWEQVEAGIYIPGRSSLGFWVTLMADRRSKDLLKNMTKRSRWESEQLMAEHPDKSVERQMEESLYLERRGMTVDYATETAEIDADRAWLGVIIEIASAVMDYRKYLMAYEVFYSFDGSAQEYAEQWGQDQGHVRACVREFKVHLQVIHQALIASLEGATGHISELVGCLPDENSAGGYRRRIAEAIVEWVSAGNSPAEVTVEFIEAHTGDSYNTIRQRLGEVLTLLRVAHTVIDLDPVETYGLERSE